MSSNSANSSSTSVYSSPNQELDKSKVTSTSNVSLSSGSESGEVSFQVTSGDCHNSLTTASYSSKSKTGQRQKDARPNKNIIEVHSRPPEDKLNQTVPADTQEKTKSDVVLSSGNRKDQPSKQTTELLYCKHSPCHDKSKKTHRGSKRHGKRKADVTVAKHSSPSCQRRAEPIKTIGHLIHQQTNNSKEHTATPSVDRRKVAGEHQQLTEPERTKTSRKPPPPPPPSTSPPPSSPSSPGASFPQQRHIQSQATQALPLPNSLPELTTKTCETNRPKTLPSIPSSTKSSLLENRKSFPLPSSAPSTPVSDSATTTSVPAKSTETLLNLYWMRQELSRSQLSLAPASTSGSLLSLNKKPSDVCVLVSSALSSLYTPFSQCSGELVRQARDILVCCYQGNIRRFDDHFLLPAASLLADFKSKERKSAASSSHVQTDEGWPLCFRHRLVVHLGEADATLLKNGDFYLCVRPSNVGVQLVLKYRSPSRPHTGSSNIRERVISTGDFGNVLAMDWLHSLQLDVASDEQLTTLLQNMLVAVEKGIDRIRWEAISRPSTCNHAAQTDEETNEKTTQLTGGQRLSLTSCSPPFTNNEKGSEGIPGLIDSPSATVLLNSNDQTDKVDKEDRDRVNSGNSSVDFVRISNVPRCNKAETPQNFGGAGLLTVVGTRDSCVQTSPLDECKTFTQQEYHSPSSGTTENCSGTGTGTARESSEKAATGTIRKSLDDGCNRGTEENPNSKIQAKASSQEKPPTKNEEQDDDGYHDNSISTPNSISEIDPALLLTKAALLTGCRDVAGRGVVTVDCSRLRPFPRCRSAQVAQLFLYYHTILRKEVSNRGLSVLVDASRETTPEAFHLLDDIFCLLEGHSPGILHTLVVWSGTSENDSKKWESVQLFPHSAIQYEVVTSPDKLHKIIKSENLLPQQGGSYHFDLEEWQEFRKRFEPFVHDCRNSGKRLVGVMQGLRGSRLPPTSTLTSQIIDEHKQHVVQTFEDPQLKHLQQDGSQILKDLEQRQHKAPQNFDFREAVTRGQALYNELHRAVIKLARLSERRLFKLEQAFQLRTFEEDTGQVLSWLCKKGEETLKTYKDIEDNLAGIRAQERDFEKFYFIAMRNIEKGHDLLEEASTLDQSGLQETSGMQDLTHSLKSHLQRFTERLEDTRDRLEDTSTCYQLLDKAYEWALEAMKFVSRMKMEPNMTPMQLTQLMKALQTYLLTHPPTSEDSFEEMIALATKLGNERLADQCKIAQARCQETTDLINTRQVTLLKARNQIGDEGLHHSQLDLTGDPNTASADGNTPLPQPTQPIIASNPSWTTAPATSTPQPFTRRRSIASVPSSGYSTPGCYVSQGYSSFFRETYHLDTYISEHDENLTEDMISEFSSVSPVPPVVLRSNGRQQMATGPPLVEDSPPPSQGSLPKPPESSLPSSNNSSIPHSKPHKKYMRRSQTWQFEMEPWQKADEPCNLEKVYAKGSTESIQTIVENEESSSLELSNENTSNAAYISVSVNSHLHHHDTTEMSPDLNDEQVKHKRTLTLIMREMVQTERDYVKSLEYTIENYIPELLREDIPQALRGKRNVVFGNIEKIYEFHSQYFLHELEQCENAPFLVGQCFLRYERQFYLYALYNKNKPKSDELMLEYGTLFFKNKQLQLRDKMDLASYLLKPVQRMGKYALLIKQLIKECPEKEPEHSDLKAAEDMVKFQLRHGNDLLAMDCIRECDVDLKEQGRLLRQDEFLVWQGKSRKCLRRHVFLFEELIVFTKARRDPNRMSRDIYQYKNSIKNTDIGLTEQVGESSAKFEIWFRKCKLNDTYILQAGSTEVRNGWVQEISKLLWKQALRNRELRLAEMSSMGIGNKPCLDIKPSQDQINDRSISINQLTKAPRFRNSIAVITTDQTRNTNKRPHSIISVSSSSSGSSQASSNQFGALNLGFDPSDSPKLHHRSITQQSQCSAESGIIPDINMGYDYIGEFDSNKKLERTSSNASTDSMCTNTSMPVSPMTQQTSPTSSITCDIATENH